MRTFIVAAIAGLMSVGVAALAPGTAHADFNPTSEGDFCYGGWSTTVNIDFEEGIVFVEDTCGDVGDTVRSYYRLFR